MYSESISEKLEDFIVEKAINFPEKNVKNAHIFEVILKFHSVNIHFLQLKQPSRNSADSAL